MKLTERSPIWKGTFMINSFQEMISSLCYSVLELENKIGAQLKCKESRRERDKNGGQEIDEKGLHYEKTNGFWSWLVEAK